MSAISTRHKVTVTAAVALLALGAGAGCDDGFLPPSYLDGLRVLAIEASPSEVGPGEQTTLTPRIYLPQGDAPSETRWTFCPLTLGAASGFACAQQSCQVAVAPASDGSVTLNPGALATRCLGQLAQAGVQLPGVGAASSGATPQRVESVAKLSVTSRSGARRVAVARLGLWPGGVPQGARNTPPVIVRVELDGVIAVEGKAGASAAESEERNVRVQIDPSSVDSFTDAAGRQRTEETIISFFTTAGRFEYDREAGLDTTVRWRAEQLEPGQTEAQIYVVARDLRGGQAVSGPFVVPIKR